MFKEIFNLTPEQLEAAKLVIASMKTEDEVVPFKNGPFNLYIVKDGTEEARHRKAMSDAIIGPVEFENQQYLVTAK